MLLKDFKMFKLVTEQYLNAVSCCYFKVFNLLMIRRSKYELCSCTCFVTFVGLTGTYKLLFFNHYVYTNKCSHCYGNNACL